MKTIWCSGIFVFVLLASCQDKSVDPPIEQDVTFEAVPVVTPLSTAIPEASGIAASATRPGFLWIQEDSGNPAEIALYSAAGLVSGRMHIQGVINRDWEDLAVSGGPDAGVHYLYLADIGNNDGTAADTKIIRFPEPAPGTDTVRSPVLIPFQYSDGPRDAEAFLVDPVSHDIFLITKRDSVGRIYRLTYPYTGSNAVAALVGQLPYSGVTGACINPEGSEILIRTYTNILYYRKNAGENIAQSLSRPGLPAQYQLEPQGEAITFGADNQGYYTLSEVAFNFSQNFYYYKRR